MALPPNKTKIVCTIGPASRSREVMEKMLRAGMNIARINFSHGDFSEHREVIENLRAAAKAIGTRLAILADLPGPKMRIGRFEREPIELEPGAFFTLTTDEGIGDLHRVSVTFSRLPLAVKPGDTLYLNDGLIQLEVDRVQENDVRCRVVVGGELRSRKGLNLPGIDLGISAFTPHDFDCLKFALENGVDAVSQSFVESSADIEAVRLAAEALGYRPFIIAKIERARALQHMEGIIAAADGLMIARGDLGVELPIEQIAVVQKQIMRQAVLEAKPVITATQMLESMTSNPRPTRAEATDVANAILDGTDGVMLSGESAMGGYPRGGRGHALKDRRGHRTLPGPPEGKKNLPGRRSSGPDVPGQADRPGGGGRPQLRGPGGRLRPHPWGRNGAKYRPLSPPGVDRRRFLPGKHLSAVAVLFRGPPGFRTRTPGKLEQLCVYLAYLPGNRGPIGGTDRRSLLQISPGQQPTGDYRSFPKPEDGITCFLTVLR